MTDQPEPPTATIKNIWVRIGGEQFPLARVSKDTFEEISKVPLIAVPCYWAYVGPNIFSIWPSPTPQCGLHVECEKP